MDTSRDSSTAKRLRVHRAIKSRRPAKTPSEFYLSFPSPLSIFPARLGSGSPATSVGFLSPSQSSGDQTLIGLDSTLPQPSPPFLSYEIFVSLAGSFHPLFFPRPSSSSRVPWGDTFLASRTNVQGTRQQLPRSWG